MWAARFSRSGDSPPGEREARDPPLALKVALDNSARVKLRFRREAMVLRKVGPPHVPVCHEAGALPDGRPWIAMDRLSGRTLGEVLAASAGPLDLAQALPLADALLSSLAAAHAHGIVHRDLKPENVFVREPGGVVLIDFGLATAPAGEEVELTRAGSALGTPYYMAPEQVHGAHEVDGRADIYAFGVILFQMVTGRLPFSGDLGALLHAHLALRPPRPGRLAKVPSALEEIVLACLAKDPDRRPATADRLREDLARRGGAVDAVAEVHRGEGLEGDASRRVGILGAVREPAVLLFADTRAALPLVVAAAHRYKGLVARQRGSRYLIVFTARDADRPASAAHEAARRIVERLGGRAALHVSNVWIRRGERGAVLVSGPDVDRSEGWTPAEPWAGLVLGAEVADLLSEGEPVAEAPLGRRRDPSLPTDEQLVPTVGQAGALAGLEQSAERALQWGEPSLSLILGDTGLGKTRLAGEAAALALATRPDVHLTFLRPGPKGASLAVEVVTLLRTALRAPDAAPPDPAAFCRAALGEAVGEELWPSLAAALGWSAGAVWQRHHLVRAIVEGLRRRAREGPVVVVLDDAHRADDTVVESLEASTLDGEDMRLWAVVTALPRFEELRPQWGARTQRFDRRVLTPLDEPAAAQLAAELLRPAEYPPASVLASLALWSEGSPGCLTELVRALKRAGVVRPRPGAESYYVATTELSRLTSSPAWQWLALRALEALPPDVASSARLCAVLGPSFTAPELSWVEEALDREGDLTAPLDAAFAVDALVDLKVLHALPGGRWAFRTKMIRDGIVDLVEPEQRRAIHRHALAYWRGRVAAGGASRELLEPLATHADACGALGEAVDAHLWLGDALSADGRHADADRHYTVALGAGAEGRQRVRALSARCRSRYRLHRLHEAVEDLGAARRAAEPLGDDALTAELLLEEATALDWAQDFAGSAARVDEAARLDVPALEAPVLVGQARTLMRRGEMTGAVELLEGGMGRLDLGADRETLMVALVLLSVGLVGAGRLDEAEVRFHQAIELATATEDGVQLAILHGNRAFLWALRRDLPRALDDLSCAVRYAREMGNPFLERQATLNVAELQHWEARGEEALGLVRRARVLEQRFLERPGAESSVLLARILLFGETRDEAARLLAELRSPADPGVVAPSTQAFVEMLEKALSPDRGPSWDDILARVEGKILETELVELLYWRTRLAVEGERWVEARATLAAAETHRDALPTWRPRFESLELRMPE